MSTEAASGSMDFWEFIACSRCQLPFMADGHYSRTPFWITECGHVVCNNHLSTDQSCLTCGAQKIQLAPLQQQLEKPMSDWFCSVPFALDTIAYAAKFQQESMANSIRHYKNKYQHHRALHLQLKQENDALKKTIARLKQELHQTPSGSGWSMPDSLDTANRNGKRPMGYPEPPGTSSSPRSSAPSIGAYRLTLPPGQQPPVLSSNHFQGNVPRPAILHPDTRTATSIRPGSALYRERFAYTRQTPRPSFEDRPGHGCETRGPLPLGTSTSRSSFEPRVLPRASNDKIQTRRVANTPTAIPFNRTNHATSSSSKAPLNTAGNLSRFLPPTSHGLSHRS